MQHGRLGPKFEVAAIFEREETLWHGVFVCSSVSPL